METVKQRHGLYRPANQVSCPSLSHPTGRHAFSISLEASRSTQVLRSSVTEAFQQMALQNSQFSSTQNSLLEIPSCNDLSTQSMWTLLLYRNGLKSWPTTPQM